MLAGQDRTGIIDITMQVGNNTTLVGQFLPDKNNTDRFALFDEAAPIIKLFGGVPDDGSTGGASIALITVLDHLYHLKT